MRVIIDCCQGYAKKNLQYHSFLDPDFDPSDAIKNAVFLGFLQQNRIFLLKSGVSGNKNQSRGFKQLVVQITSLNIRIRHPR